MQVTFQYRESTGEYKVKAFITRKGKVELLDIVDEYRQAIDEDDFSASELNEMRALALAAYKALVDDDDNSYLDRDSGEDEGEDSYA